MKGMIADCTVLSIDSVHGGSCQAGMLPVGIPGLRPMAFPHEGETSESFEAVAWTQGAAGLKLFSTEHRCRMP